MKTCYLYKNQISDYQIQEYQDVEIANFTVNNNTEIPLAVFQLPKIHTIEFGSSTVLEQQWKNFIHEVSKHPKIKHLSLSNFPTFPADITSLQHLTSIEIDATQTNATHLEFVISQLKLFPFLEKIGIRGSKEDISLKAFTMIGEIPTLNTLQIGWNINTEYYDWQVLKNIKKLVVSYFRKPLSEKINQMPNLEELFLYHSTFDNLNFTPNLKKLHTLEIHYESKYSNSFAFDLSDDFIRLLSQIKLLNIHMLPKNASVKLLVDLHKAFVENPDKANMIADAITQYHTEKYTIPDLLSVLHIKKAQINQKIWTVIEKRLDTEKEVILENVKTYFLLGKPTKSTELRANLKTLGWKPVKESKIADCIIICKEQNKNNDFNKDFNVKKAVSESYLLAWVQKNTGVEPLDKTYNNNLLLLLKSDEIENKTLALEILKNHYTPDKILDTYLLGIALFSEDKTIKEKAKKLIEKNFSSSLLAEYKKNNRRGYESETYEILKQLPEIDAFSFAEVVLSCTQGHGLRTLGYLDILQLGGEKMPLALEAIGSSFSVQINNISSIHPDFLKYFPNKCKNITCSHTLLEVQEIVFQLQHITEIRLENLEELHESIGNMSSITNIGFSVKNLKSYPETLSKLTNVEYLEIFDRGTTTHISEAFSSWKKLKNLRIYMENLHSLPNWLEDLKNLQFCEITGKDHLLALDSIFSNQNLEKLVLKIDGGSLDLSQVKAKNLRELDISLGSCQENENSSISNQHFKLLEKIIVVSPSELTKLTFSTNYLNKISDKLLKFDKLEELYLGGIFEEIPDFIATLPIKSLGLLSNKLTELPYFIKDMKNLKYILLPYTFQNKKATLQKKMPHIYFKVK
ncbi:MAG: hypothetical protein MUC49_12310 [Raineya sp.]|jgi:hypothetical protein|nr:hypothetical protein [Raineya sp.]